MISDLWELRGLGRIEMITELDWAILLEGVRWHRRTASKTLHDVHEPTPCPAPESAQGLISWGNKYMLSDYTRHSQGEMAFLKYLSNKQQASVSHT